MAFADLEGRDRVVRAGFDDLVEHARKDQRVDDVPAELDDLDVHARQDNGPDSRWNAG